MTKEKQIEEIAKRIHIATDLYYMECIKIATYLFEKDNCRIIDKDSVVLTREEYNDLKLQIQQAHNKGVRVGFDLTKYKENSIEQARKETAKEILSELDLFLKGTTLRKGYEFNKINEKLKEIAEKYGVEVEE